MISNFQLSPPADWQAFERLCHLLWSDLLKDPNTQKNGRQGQAQAGVDVYGDEKETGKSYGIQCKGKTVAFGKQVTEEELREEVENAKSFVPALNVFILATTAPNDANIQKVARNITKQNEKLGLFKVVVYGWDEITSRIPFSPKVINEFYPQYSQSNSELKDTMDKVLRIMTERSEPDISELLTPVVSSFFQNRKEAVDTFKKSSENLLGWPRTLQVNNQWIERTEEENVFIRFDKEISSTTIILGDPGTGKSALLSKIGQDLKQKNEMVLAIKADYLDNNITDFTSLAKDLNLPGPIDKCLLQASAFGQVYLIIDQLDTLSELIDMKTQRLSVLLTLIRQLSGTDNVHILASSRPFEFKYDSRLNSLKAKKIILPDLKWDVVEQILSERGIQLFNTDSQFKAFLCRPNNLNFYLTYLQEHPERAFVSHIELYDEIWNSSLGDGDARSRRAKLLEEIATIMTNEAKQSLPLVKVENLNKDIDWLCTAGILVKINNDKSVAFTHQTLQAYVWTRSFVKENNSLITFVRSHQNNLNIRPKLTTVLFFLRDADVDEYNRQINEILIDQRQQVRNHIMHLVIECVGASNVPYEQELGIFKKLMAENGLRPRIVNSILGKTIWFDKFLRSYLPSLMTGTENEKYITAGFLSSVFVDRNDVVVELIDKHWSNPKDVNFIFYTLRGITNWDDSALKFAIYIATHKDSNRNTVSVLFYLIAQSSANAAIKFAGAYFRDKLEALEIVYVTLFSEDDTEEEFNWQSDRYSLIRQFEDLAEMGTDWHNLPEIAAKNPALFVEEFWNFFIKICERTRFKQKNDEQSYIETHGHWFHLSDEGHDYGDRYFSSALEASIKAIATEVPETFKKLFQASQENDSLLVQRTLAKGLAAIAPSDPNFVLGLLLSEPRRFKLGYMEDKHSGTKEIIASLCTALPAEEIAELEGKILNYQARAFSSDRTVEGKKWDIQHNRYVIYFLLTAIPESLRSEKANRLMQMEERAFGTSIKKGSKRGGFSGLLKQISPMTLEQMIKAKDEDIIKCFLDFPDGKETDWHNTEGVYYGSTEFGRAFEEFAISFPDRAIEIIQRLAAANIQSISSGIIGLAKSNITLTTLLEVINSLISKFTDAYFFEEIVRAIREKLSQSTGEVLDNYWCEKLESWLPLLITDRGTDTEDGTQSDRKERRESIIWNWGQMIYVPSGSFSILDFLSLVYLNRNNPQVEKWIKMIKTHLLVKDSPDVWYMLLILRLPWALSRCSSADVSEILDLLLDRFPGAIKRKELAHTLVRAIHSVSDTKFYEWMGILKLQNESVCQQMFGELIVAKALIHREDETAISIINELISSPATNQDILNGIAYACRHEWNNFKEFLTPFIVQLLNNKNPAASGIVLEILNNHDGIAVDEYLNAVLDAAIESQTFRWLEERIYFLPKLLNQLAYVEPDRVVSICNDMIDKQGKDLGNISTAAAAESPELISASITLHNLGPLYQAKGLDIFEKLIELDAYQIRDALQQIDGTPHVKLR